MSTFLFRNAAIVIALLAICVLPCRGQIAELQDAKSPTQQWLEQRQAEFQEYRLEHQGAKPNLLTMEPRSILNWSNPERGTDNGAVFLWTAEGRPQMIACAFEWGGSLKHEFQSLSTDHIAAQRVGEPVHRFGPGVEWKELPRSPAPTKERALRLAQMRRQTERFRVMVGNKEWTQTRQLPQPVFRSPSTASSDVALFLFVQGTDPECTLLLESTPQREWRYALARQTKWGLKVSLDEAEIWEALPFGKPDPQSPFLVIPQNAAH